MAPPTAEIAACRLNVGSLNLNRGSHAGLLLDRYLRSAKSPEAKAYLHNAAQKSSEGTRGLYKLAFERRANWASDTQGVEPFTLATPDHQRLVVGLGIESPLDTGLHLHHTYGVPIIPGTALKGLASHYAAQALELQPNVHKIIFGDTEDAGFVTFHDAWIATESLDRPGEGLLADIMTPHHSSYYGGELKGGQRVNATDFDSPIPVKFLSVRGTFHFVLECEDLSDPGLKWLSLAAGVLKSALADWGVGGKTSSGYGRLVDPTTASPVSSQHEKSRSDSPTMTSPTSGGLPPVNSYVDVTILTERTKPGGLKVRHESGMTGPITNWKEVPADLVAAGRLTLRVGVSKLDASFEFVTDEERAKRLKRSQAHPANRSLDRSRNDKGRW